MTTSQASYGRLPRLRIATLTFDETRQLAAQESGNREPAFSGEHSCFAKRFLVEREGDVARG
jgi:hypothetical protein